jgi:hypothetical protein
MDCLRCSGRALRRLYMKEKLQFKTHTVQENFNIPKLIRQIAISAPCITYAAINEEGTRRSDGMTSTDKQRAGRRP